MRRLPYPPSTRLPQDCRSRDTILLSLCMVDARRPERAGEEQGPEQGVNRECTGLLATNVFYALLYRRATWRPPHDGGKARVQKERLGKELTDRAGNGRVEAGRDPPTASG